MSRRPRRPSPDQVAAILGRLLGGIRIGLAHARRAIDPELRGKTAVETTGRVVRELERDREYERLRRGDV